MVVSHPEYAAKMTVSNARNRADLAAAAAAAVSAATPTLGLGAEADDESDYDADDAAAAEMEQADDDGADDEPSTRKKTTAESQAEALKLRATIRSDFWEDSSEVLELFSLLLYYLRVVDESNRSVMGWIWPMMYSLQKKMKAKLLVGDYTGRMPLREREAAVEYIDERWAYLHVPMHSAAFCVNPRFHGINHFEDMEVRDDFVSVVSDMLGDAHEAKVLEVITEYEAYHQKTGAWSSPLCWHDYKTVEPLTFWKRWKATLRCSRRSRVGGSLPRMPRVQQSATSRCTSGTTRLCELAKSRTPSRGLSACATARQHWTRPTSATPLRGASASAPRLASRHLRASPIRSRPSQTGRLSTSLTERSRRWAQ
jgi:hypothetical protein